MSPSKSPNATQPLVHKVKPVLPQPSMANVMMRLTTPHQPADPFKDMQVEPKQVISARPVLVHRQDMRPMQDMFDVEILPCKRSNPFKLQKDFRLQLSKSNVNAFERYKSEYMRNQATAESWICTDDSSTSLAPCRNKRLAYLLDMMPEPRSRLKSRKVLSKIRYKQVNTIPDEFIDHAQALQQMLAQLEGDRPLMVDHERGPRERSIAQIIDLVSQWRMLYDGIMLRQPDGTMVRKEFTLEQSAALIKVSKKSLDDYLLYLRYGRRFNFDFDANINEGIGFLRAYVNAKKKELLKYKKGNGNMSSLSKVKQELAQQDAMLL